MLAWFNLIIRPKKGKTTTTHMYNCVVKKQEMCCNLALASMQYSSGCKSIWLVARSKNNATSNEQMACSAPFLSLFYQQQSLCISHCFIKFNSHTVHPKKLTFLGRKKSYCMSIY
jgi:hypothetical protein